MKKLRLDMDALEVQSFAAEDAGRAVGTVEARESVAYSGCACPAPPPTEDGEISCAWTRCYAYSCLTCPDKQCSE